MKGNNMGIETFKDLRVWSSAHQLTLEIYKSTENFPKKEIFGVISQIRRSSVSVGANIAEGRKKSTKDFIRFLEIAQGFLEETKYYLLLSFELNYLVQEKFDQLSGLADDTGKMLSGLINKLKLNTYHVARTTYH